MSIDHLIAIAILVHIGIGLFGAGIGVGAYLNRRYERRQRTRRLEAEDPEMAAERRWAHEAAKKAFPELASW